jgi:hypothetical protein
MLLLWWLVGLLAPLNQHYTVSAFRFNVQVAKQCATVGPTGGRRVLMTTYLADDATSNIGGSTKSSKKAAECLTPLQKEEAIAELRKIKERLRKAEHKLNSTLLEISEDNGSHSAGVPKRPPATDAISTSIERHAPITSSYLENLSSKPCVKGESDTLFPVTADVVAPSVVAQVPLPVVQTTTLHELTPPTTTTTTANETEPPTTSINEELVHDDIPSVEDLEDEVEFVKAQIKKLREEMAAERANILKSLADMKQQKRPKDVWQHKRLEDVE